jgi:hypothetical protein
MGGLDRQTVRDGLAAGAVAAVLSGGPSTLAALRSGDSPMEATLAAGTLLLPRERRPVALALAAVPVHLALSLGWAVVLAEFLPRRHTTRWGAASGLAIAVLDLGVFARRYPRLRALRTVPQVADHVAFGATAGAVLALRRRARPE